MNTLGFQNKADTIAEKGDVIHRCFITLRLIMLVAHLLYYWTPGPLDRAEFIYFIVLYEWGVHTEEKSEWSLVGNGGF